MLPEFVEKFLHKLASELGFIDYVFDFKPGSSHGDNYLGSIIAVTVTGARDKSGECTADKVHWIVKVSPSDDKNRNEIDILYGREFHTYTNILPRLVELQQEKGLNDVDSFHTIPKVYSLEHDKQTNTRALIMENLRTKGYVMWPRKKPISLDHALLMVDTLGKFHGVSFAFKDQHPHEFSAFKSTTDLFRPLMANGMLKSKLKELFIWFSECVTSAAHKEYLRNFDILRSLDAIFDYGACDKFGVITHGDCWTNNFMFAYGDENVNTLDLLCHVNNSHIIFNILYAITGK